MTTTKVYIFDHEQAHRTLQNALRAQGFDDFKTHRDGIRIVYDITGEFDETSVQNAYWFLGCTKTSSGTGEVMEPLEVGEGSVINDTVDALINDSRLGEAEAALDFIEHSVSGLADE